MSLDGRAGLNNRLLLSLPPQALERLWQDLEPVNIPKGHVICHIGDPVEYLYFPNCGMISVFKPMKDGRSVGVREVGIEGVTNPNVLYFVHDAMLEKVVHLPGTALRVRREALRREIAKDEAVRSTFEKYNLFVAEQLAQTSACNRLHEIEERLCRWLLVANDNALCDNFLVTHEFLAEMLGVQRTGISLAANLLRATGLIGYSRGHVTILNRGALEQAACECY